MTCSLLLLFAPWPFHDCQLIVARYMRTLRGINYQIGSAFASLLILLVLRVFSIREQCHDILLAKLFSCL